jgi:hypothetical protein
MPPAQHQQHPFTIACCVTVQCNEAVDRPLPLRDNNLRQSSSRSARQLHVHARKFFFYIAAVLPASPAAAGLSDRAKAGSSAESDALGGCHEDLPPLTLTCCCGAERHIKRGQQRARRQRDAHQVVHQRPAQVLPDLGQRRPPQVQRLAVASTGWVTAQVSQGASENVSTRGEQDRTSATRPPLVLDPWRLCTAGHVGLATQIWC